MSTAVETRPTASWATPAGRLVLPADAAREQWLVERRKGLGGSDASVVAGVSRWSSRYELWLDKTGQLPEREATPQMRMGNKLEPVIVECFNEDTGIETRRCGLLRSRQWPWMQVTVDRLTADGGIFEAKKTTFRLADEWDNDQISDAAEVQAQWGLAVTGRSHAWVSVMIDGGWPQFRRVERDDALINDLVELGRWFWHDHVLTNTAPAVEAKTLDVIKNRYATGAGGYAAAAASVVEPLIAQWMQAKDDEKRACTRKQTAEAQLRELVKTADTLLVGTDPVLTCKANGTFSQARFIAEYPDLAAELQTLRPALDVDRLKTEHPDIYSQFRARVLRPVTKKGA